jgi:sterol desaturase/sphingolipid hydroxylase (fatty acid hydroxylase superfamily)
MPPTPPSPPSLEQSTAPGITGPTLGGRIRAVFRHALPPLFIVGYPALGIAALVNGSLVAVYLVYAVVAGTALLAERFMPWVPNRRWRSRSADVLYLVTSPFILVGIQLGVLPALEYVRNLFLGGREIWASFLPMPFQVVLLLLLVEFVYYGAHRLSHRSGLFWRSHRIHHSAESLDWLVGWRIQWINEVLHVVARFVPFVVLGVPPHVLAIALVILNANSMYPHINADINSGFFNAFIGTPEIHRRHHLKDLKAGASTFCAFLMVWDRVFGTYRRPGVTADAVFGVPDAELKRVPQSWTRQLISPFTQP